MSAAVAERTVIRQNPKGDEADPIFEKEMYDPDTGERIPQGWKRQPTTGRDDDEFTVLGPEVSALGLQPQYGRGRRGRYVVAGQLEGRVW
jgi:hypothetical protein